ncbi:MAG TPA: ATP-binding protein [Drouetiella sp.]|jgi:two-component system, sensor histidine kinase and response regulator
MEETRLHLQNITVLLGETPISGTMIIKPMLREAFGEAIKIVEVETVAAVEHALAAGGIDVILLDFDLIDSQQMKTVETIRDMTAAPLVVLGLTKDEPLVMGALKAGAQDFLYKNAVSAKTLWRAIAFAIERNQNRLEELERLHLLELREDFMLTLTHDLKSPLIGSNRLIELITANNTRITPEQQKGLLSQIRDSNTNLLAIIQSLCEVYKYEKDLHEMHFEKTDLLAVVNGYLRSVRHLMEDKRIVTHVVNNTNDAVILADSMSISRVVQNLIENAIKFSPVEGRVEISLKQQDDHVMINVSDEGPGIEPQDLQKLFMRFYQGRPGRSYNYGMGLGLYLCRQIVEAHSGKIWCNPNEESGAVFTVSLPTAKPPGSMQ